MTFPVTPRVRVLVVEPDGLGVDRVADDVMDEQAVLGQVQLDAAGLPGQLDVAVADVLDQVGFDEGALDAHAGDAADPDLVDMVAADDGVPDGAGGSMSQSWAPMSRATPLACRRTQSSMIQ